MSDGKSRSAGKARWFWARFNAAVFGKPISNSQAHHERLSPFLGLPVFASDALSSVAYGTEAILGILILGSTTELKLLIPITIGIAILIAIIATSYNQTIHAYPHGGGSYIVASENLGERAGLLAGASLMIDYVLTVSVSVAAGMAAITSAFPELHTHIVPLSVIAILAIAYLNLRGVRESGAVFAIPVYGFIVGMFALILVGLLRSHGIPVHQTTEHAALNDAARVGGIYLILRAYAAGCTALTGVEAVSDGVPAFKAPEAENASRTLKMMAFLLIFMFLGIGILAGTLPHLNLYDSSSPNYRSVISQIAAAYLGGTKSVWFYYVQFTTALILVLAANTSFADFPRLGSFIARDGYLPRAFARQGDRLVFTNGIVMLALFSCGLIIYFKGQLDALLPLYAVGVFSAFTLSQIGMVVHWKRLRTPGWMKSATINGIGASLSGLVLGVILFTKFLEGAWVVVVLMALLYAMFFAIKHRYRRIGEQLSASTHAIPRTNRVLLLVPRLHNGILQALEYSRMIRGDLEAIHITLDERRLPSLQRSWKQTAPDVPLKILPSPYRSLMEPLLSYLDYLKEQNPDEFVTVIVPEAISKRFTGKFLQENVALQIKVALSTRENVVVTNVRYFID